MQGHINKSPHNYELIDTKDGMLRLKKSSEIYKDFGKLFYKI